MGLDEAWSRWLEADATLRDASLWGVQIVWWGRFGKVAAFLAGLVIILDIVGTERLTRLTTTSGDRLRRGDSRILTAYVVGATIAVVAFVIWVVSTIPFNPPEDEYPMEASTNPAFILAVVLGLAVVVFSWKALRWLLIWVFEHNRLAFTVRLTSVLLLLIGFHFDMLAS
jgi:hypothetical protein